LAYIIKGSGATVAEPVSALAKSADFGRQRDVYVLASKYRNRDCIRLWNDFAAEQPAMARLIVKDVENDRQEAAAVNEGLDARLREAERLVVKARKPKAVKGRGKTPASAPFELGALQAAETVLRLAERESRNPELRVWAEMAARRVQG